MSNLPSQLEIKLWWTCIWFNTTRLISNICNFLERETILLKNGATWFSKTQSICTSHMKNCSPGRRHPECAEALKECCPNLWAETIWILSWLCSNSLHTFFSPWKQCSLDFRAQNQTRYEQLRKYFEFIAHNVLQTFWPHTSLWPQNMWYKVLCFWSLNLATCPKSVYVVTLKYEEMFFWIDENVFQGLFFWEKSRPSSFQSFRNMNFGKTDPGQYGCYTYRLLHNSQWRVHCLDHKTAKYCASKQVFPHRTRSHTCTMMMLTNLAAPDWLLITCTDKLLADVICTVENSLKLDSSNKTRNKLEPKARHTCQFDQLFYHNKCYQFLWKSKLIAEKHLLELCHSKDTVSFKSDIKIFENVFNAVSVAFPVFLLPSIDNLTHMVMHTVQRNLNVLKFDKTTVQPQVAAGLLICESSLKEIVTSVHSFHCSGGGHVASIFVCDKQKDCPNDFSDESECISGSTSEKKGMTPFPHRYVKSSENNQTICGPLYYMGSGGSCHQFLVVEKHNKSSSSDTSRVGSVCTVQTALLDDLFGDCGPGADDEQILKALLKDGNSSLCTRPDQLPCLDGHSRCFNISHICVFRLKENKYLLPCRNGAHLENCNQFQCDKNFKCRDSYCIPWSHVCDTKWDCSSGEDEHNKQNCSEVPACVDKFKCKDTALVCIHLGDICDAQSDCPLGDDEYFCELKSITCPETCNCFLFAIQCFKITFSWNQNFPFVSFSVHHSPGTNLREVTKSFQNAQHLNLTNNSIQQFCGEGLPPNILLLDLRNNLLEALKKNCLSNVNRLKVLLLDSNLICCVETQSFVNITALLVLSLSNNPATNLATHVFLCLPSLKIISLLNIGWKNIHPSAFDKLHVDVILTTDFHICCVKPIESECTNNMPWFLSCSDLLLNDAATSCVISATTLILVFTVGSVIIHLLIRGTRITFLVTIVAVNASDFLFGAYLGLLWIAHTYFQGIFMVVEETWRSGVTCFFAFGIYLSFTLLSPLLLSFMSLSRLMVVVLPFDTAFKRLSFVLKWLALIFASSLVLSTALTVTTKILSKVLPLNICTPFTDPTCSHVPISVVTWFTVFSTMLASAAIIWMHMMLVSNLEKSQQNIRRSTSNDNNATLVFQLIAVCVSNILCWVPANIVHLSAMFLSKYPIGMIVWTTVAVAPINSLMNSLIYIVVCLKKFFSTKKRKGNQIEIIKQSSSCDQQQVIWGPGCQTEKRKPHKCWRRRGHSGFVRLVGCKIAMLRNHDSRKSRHSICIWFFTDDYRTMNTSTKVICVLIHPNLVFAKGHCVIFVPHVKGRNCTASLLCLLWIKRAHPGS